MHSDVEKRLGQVYEAGGDQAKLNTAYDDWAESYERDLWSSGNPYLAVTAGYVARYVGNKDAHILDAGCGPGNLAHILKLLGYTNILGLDASEKMAAKAKQKHAYRDVIQKTLTDQPPFLDRKFDAVLVSGVLTKGHASPAALDGLIAVTKPNAHIIFSMSQQAFENDGYKTKCDELTKRGAWQIVEQSDAFQTFPFIEEHQDVRHWISVFRVQEI